MDVTNIKIGNKVKYHSIITDDGKKYGTKDTVITSEPWQLGHGDYVCKVEGVSGGVLITHLEEA